MTATVDAPTVRAARLPADVLQDAVKWALRGISSRPPNAVLLATRITISGGQIEAVGFDYDTATRYRAGIDDDRDFGAVHVSAHDLARIAGTLRGDVTFTLEDRRLTLSARGRKFTLPVINGVEYPSLPELPEMLGRAASFASAVTEAAEAASREVLESDVAMLAGIDLHAVDRTMWLHSTDRYRASRVATDWDGPDFAPITVPAAALAALVKEMGGGVSQIGVADGLLGLHAGNRAATLRTYARAFPEIARLWPGRDAGQRVLVEIPRENLLDAVKAAALLSNDAARITLDVADGRIAVTNADVGRGEGSVDADDAVLLDGEPAPVDLHAARFSTLLAVLPHPIVQLDMAPGGAAKPLTLAGLNDPGGETDPRHLHLILPLRPLRK